jgi:predicted GH43/DUF377 family glycosyl hydrolase
VSVKLRRYEKNPILSPNPKHHWESLVTTNPGVWYEPETNEVTMLYRAAGDEPEHFVYLGLAKSKNGYDFERVSEQPVFGPSKDGFDAGCVEDPRVIKIGEWYYVTYASRPYPPGEYWVRPESARRYRRPATAPDFPWILRENATATGLALTKDFKTWIRAGRLTNPGVDDRDVILWPEKVNGYYYMMHRPMNWTGAAYGTEHPAMWVSRGKDILAFGEPKMMAKAEYDWEHKIGGNTPPIKTKNGWLTIYHAVGPDKYYRLGAMLLDLNDPYKVTHRTRDWILQPEKDYEIEGFYKGVCFPCGSCIIKDTFFVYYGGADKYVGVATCPIAELMDYLQKCPV